MSSLRKTELPHPSLDELSGFIELELTNSVCIYCKEELTIKEISLDHKYPLSRAGTNSLDNLQIICKKCNRLKSDLTNFEFVSFLDYLRHIPVEAKNSIIKRLGMGSAMYGRRR